MMHRLLVIALSTTLASLCAAQDPEPTQIRVGTKIAPPFVVERDDGTLGGLAIELLEAVAADAGFTAAIATSLTLSGLGSGVQSSADLSGRIVAALEGSTSVDALRSLGARVKRFESGDAAIRALASGEVEAVVHDEPVLRWWLASSDDAEGMGVLPVVFEPQDYGFALPEDNELREAVNRAVLSRTSGEAWRERVSRAIASGGR